MKKTRDITERLGRIVAGLPRQKQGTDTPPKRRKLAPSPPEPPRSCRK